MHETQKALTKPAGRAMLAESAVKAVEPVAATGDDLATNDTATDDIAMVSIVTVDMGLTS